MRFTGTEYSLDRETLILGTDVCGGSSSEK
jgi:hypothetical protein